MGLNKILLCLLVVGVIVLVLLSGLIPRGILNGLTTTVAILGIIIAFVQAKLASQQAKKASQQVEQTLTTDILSKLYGMYIQRDMHQAITDVWQAMKQDGRGVNTIEEFLEISDRYQFLKKYIDTQTAEEKKKLDESRRMVTHFWYLIVNLVNKDALQKQDVFEWFGPPDVIWVLEGLEVIKQNLEMTGSRKRTRWPPLQLLYIYYKLKGITVEALDAALIPVARIDREVVKQIREL